MKRLVVALLSLFGFGYLALCAFGIAMTGSTAGLAEIGDAAFPAAIVGALAALLSRL